MAQHHKIFPVDYLNYGNLFLHNNFLDEYENVLIYKYFQKINLNIG